MTFTNYPGEVALLHGNTRVNGSYVIFRGSPIAAPGLIFEGPTGQRLGLIEVMNTHDVTFDHVEIRNADYHAGLFQQGGYNIRVLGSYVHDNGRFNMTLTPEGSLSYNVDQGIYWDTTSGGGNLIANCVVEHNRATGIQLYPDPSGVVVEENTIVNNDNYGMVVYGTQNIVVNNILANNGGVANNPQMNINSGTNHLIDSNTFWSASSSLQGYINTTGQVVTHSLLVDPLFVNAGQGNYHLMIGSPAIGAGNLGQAQPVDKDNVSRGAGPDLGAYEYVP
jgi:hypothetical protein